MELSVSLMLAFLLGGVSAMLIYSVLYKYLPNMEYWYHFSFLSTTKTEKLITTEWTRRVERYDTDRNKHLNNAGYIYVLNFSRRDYFLRTGIWKYLNNLKVNMVIKNQVIRYRKEIKQGDVYTIATTIIGYNDKDYCFIVESKFIINGFIHAIHYCSYKLLPSVITPSQVLLSCQIYSNKTELDSKLQEYKELIDQYDLFSTLSSKQLLGKQ